MYIYNIYIYIYIYIEYLWFRLVLVWQFEMKRLTLSQVLLQVNHLR